MVDDTLELSNLAELLCLRYLPAPDTLFKNICKVRPGHVVEIDFRTRKLSICEYPVIGRSNCQPSVRTREDAIEQYGALLDQAVKRQLLSDVEIGVLLSGGIDSALVATIAQKYNSSKTKAFTVGFSRPDDSDELADAQESARILGLDHHEVRMDYPDFLDILPRVSAIVEEPLATTSMVPMFYVSSLASKQVKVVLSGQGADEALGGYRRYKAEIVRSLCPALALPFLAMAAQPTRSFRGVNAIGERDDVRRFEAIYSVFNRDQIARLIGYDASRATERIRYFFELLGCSTQRRSVERMMSIDLRMNLADDLLLYTDKITMHHSIECRVPLLDLDLIRFVESLPSGYRTNLFCTKIVHKQFARRILPASIVNRKKKGFKSPAGRWFRADTSVRDILLDSNSRFCSHFNRREVKHILDEHSAGMDRERQIFLLLSIFYWMQGASQPARYLPRQAMSLHA
ncbi:MAG: asparagine synthase [Acidobacteria bacterium]|nr:asparagine synthase [Acidobacteriota bacterium]